MTDYETYTTYRDAADARDNVCGWSTKIAKLYLPDDSHANAQGDVYVIECDGHRYLRTDGYVR